MRLDFGGRVALVTGGASGLGRAAAARLLRDNARVVILDRDEDALADAAAELGAVPVALDVTEKAGWIGAVERIEADHGLIAVLVTAAGVLEPPRPPERITEQAWDKTFAVNLEGTRLGCQIVGARMAARGAGSIVTVASIAAFEPGPLVIYGPAKAAVVALTQALAGAWGRRGVRINAVAPPSSPPTPLRRLSAWCSTSTPGICSRAAGRRTAGSQPNHAASTALRPRLGR
jgi:NAD(P)-dependent dehydrogenase (short-subunit alcohol dehydrogenase family)